MTYKFLAAALYGALDDNAAWVPVSAGDLDDARGVRDLDVARGVRDLVVARGVRDLDVVRGIRDLEVAFRCLGLDLNFNGDLDVDGLVVDLGFSSRGLLRFRTSRGREGVLVCSRSGIARGCAALDRTRCSDVVRGVTLSAAPTWSPR